MQQEQVTVKQPVKLSESVLPKNIIDRDDRSIQGPAITRDHILVICKTSSFLWQLENSTVSADELKQQLLTQGECGERTIASHHRQMQVLEDIAQELSPAQIVTMNQVTQEQLERAQLIISLGGDDHFKAVSHLIDDQRPIVALNSDPKFSLGELVSFLPSDIPELFGKIERGDYRIQPWTRIRVHIDGSDFGPALSEVVIGKLDMRLMSTNQVEYRGESYLLKSSGILVSTGTGSTGWYTGAKLYLSPQGDIFESTDLEARFVLREPHVHFVEQDGVRKLQFPPLLQGSLEEGEKLVITSYNNSQGIISRDSIDEIPFKRSSRAEIEIDSKPLWVAVPERRGVL